MLGTAVSVLGASSLLSGCGHAADPELTARVRVTLMDWHVTGLWVINCPVAWLKVSNYNNVAIHDITVQYKTFDEHGRPLDTGEFTIEGAVGPMTSKNFAELYLGLVDLYSERLMVSLVSVKRMEGQH